AQLPVSMEFVGRPFAEAKLFEIASAYEKLTRHRRPPAGFGPLPGERGDYFSAGGDQITWQGSEPEALAASYFRRSGFPALGILLTPAAAPTHRPHPPPPRDNPHPP